jgi:hypothetical protein
LGGVLVQLINVDAATMLAGGLKEIATADPNPDLACEGGHDDTLGE